MAKYQLRSFLDIKNAVCEQLKIQKTDLESVRRIARNINQIYLDEVVPFKQWEWLRQTRTIQTEPYFNTGTAVVTQNDVNVTLTQSPGTSRAGYYFASMDGSQIYRIQSHVGGTPNLILETPFNDATNLLATYKIWNQGLALPSSCKEVVNVTSQYMASPLQEMPIHQFRRLDTAYGLTTGRPTAYTLGAFRDPERYAAIPGFPALVSRTSGGLTKKLTFASGIPSSVSAGSYINISGVGSASYNGEFVVSNVTGPILTYTGVTAVMESGILDIGGIVSLQNENDLSSYRELLIHPAIYDKRSTLVVDMQMSPEPLENDNDEPLMPVEDRIVLYYGAMWLSASRERNESLGQENYSLMQAKLTRMSGKMQASAEAPVMKLSSNYLFGKRRNSFGRGSYGQNDSTPFTAGGGSGGTLVTGTPNSVAIFNEAGELVGSADIDLAALEFLVGAQGGLSAVLPPSTTTLLNTWSATTYKGLQMYYQISRGALFESGTFYVATNGSITSYGTGGTFGGDVGISLTADIFAGNIRVQAVSNASGPTATISYRVILL